MQYRCMRRYVFMPENHSAKCLPTPENIFFVKRSLQTNTRLSVKKKRKKSCLPALRAAHLPEPSGACCAKPQILTQMLNLNVAPAHSATAIDG